MHYVYIIYTDSFDRYYIGETADVNERLHQHNDAFYPGASTSYTNDWSIKLVLQLVNRSEALKVEKYLKSMKSKQYLKRLLTEPDFFAGFKALVRDKFNIVII